jgi:Amt family ammonium transporter
MDPNLLCSAVIATGAVAERGRLGPILIFVFLWSTIVYNPIACWTWNPIGWGRRLGVLDFAGGIAVHACSGASALAMSIYLRPRYQYSPEDKWSQNNLVNIILGTVMMWYGKKCFYLSNVANRKVTHVDLRRIGWFGFNGGSALSANLTAVQAVINTNIAAAAGGITGVLIVRNFRFFYFYFYFADL